MPRELIATQCFTDLLMLFCLCFDFSSFNFKAVECVFRPVCFFSFIMLG